jgi:hypothetical protein
MRIERLAILVVWLFALIAVSCGSYGSGSTSGPNLSTDPPWGLDGVEMPNDSDAVEALLAAFPQELDGLERSDVSPTQVSYGDGATFVRAIDLEQVEAEGFPGTAPEYLDLLAGSGEVDVEAQVTDAAFVYLVSTNSVQDAPDAEARTTYDAAWGDADGGWLFVSSATSPEDRVALASAFASAAGSA